MVNKINEIKARNIARGIDNEINNHLRFHAYADYVGLYDSMIFDGIKVEFAEPVAEISDLVIGKNRGDCPAASEINDAYTTFGKDITLEFSKKEVKPSLLSRIFGAIEVLYQGTININDVPKYSFSSLYREKGNKRGIIRANLEEIK